MINSEFTHFINHHKSNENKDENGHSWEQSIQQSGVAGAAALFACEEAQLDRNVKDKSDVFTACWIQTPPTPTPQPPHPQASDVTQFNFPVAMDSRLWRCTVIIILLHTFTLLTWHGKK